MRFAPEGWPVMGTVAGVLGMVAVIGTLAGHPVTIVLPVAGIAACAWFFRDPERTAPGDERQIVSPADGRVVAVVADEREDRFLHAAATRISIFMSPLDVHVNRSPVSGTVETVRHTAGRFRAAFSDKASLDNERNAVVLQGRHGRCLYVQIAGAVARRIVCPLVPGDTVRRGERVGMIMFGSRVDLFLPPGARPVVARGTRVHAGATVVAEVAP